jgi:PAS domain S-box-containing protein
MNDATLNAGVLPTILVVGGTPTDLGVIVESLANRGFRVLVAFEDEKVLERAQSSRPDLILLDVEMPGIDGFEICRRLKMIEQTREIPVIFMISLAGSDDMVEGFAAGGVDYVIKPVRVDEMSARIRAHLASRATRKQLAAQNQLLIGKVAVHKQAEATLSPLHGELEARVAQRAEELGYANADLTSEIDEHKRAEARFRTIVEASPMPLCVTSISGGRILYMNEPLRELFGPDMSRHPIGNIVDFYVDYTERARVVERLSTEGSSSNTEVQFRRPDGTTFWAMATVRVATYDDAPAVYAGLNDITERKRIEHELIESREQLRELSAYMEAIREEERKRIAMEVHDELGQVLTTLKMNVSLLKMRLAGDSDAAKKADEMRELVEKGIWMVRNVASHLRPAALNFGIVSALEWLVEDFGRHSGIACQFRINGGEPVLEDAVATAVFRIAQASLTNVARHARASRVAMTLTSSETGLDLHVGDDGCGFDQEAARKGSSYGLLGMTERARLIGGSLQVDSVPGTGTTIAIHVPFGAGSEK